MDPSSERTAVLCDEQPLWLAAVERVLKRSGIEPVASVTCPTKALEEIEQHEPDLFLVDPDTCSAGFSGLTCLREARARIPKLRAVALSASDDAERINAAFAAGASAYVTKAARPDDLASAIRQAFERSIYLAAPEEGPAPRRRRSACRPRRG